MSNNKPFTTYSGVFICQKCKEEVYSLRMWKDTKDLTWQCSKKHISKVNLAPRTKKDYERKNRE